MIIRYKLAAAMDLTLNCVDTNYLYSVTQHPIRVYISRGGIAKPPKGPLK